MVVHCFLSFRKPAYPPIRRSFGANRAITIQDCQLLAPLRAWKPSMEYRFLVGGSRRDRDSCCARSLPEARVTVDPITDVQHKLRSCARDTFAVRHVIEGPLKLGMLIDVTADFLEALACRFETLLEFSFGFDLGFTEGHLHAAVCV